jgi:hypothetical protein
LLAEEVTRSGLDVQHGSFRLPDEPRLENLIDREALARRRL